MIERGLVHAGRGRTRAASGPRDGPIRNGIRYRSTGRHRPGWSHPQGCWASALMCSSGLVAATTACRRGSVVGGFRHHRLAFFINGPLRKSGAKQYPSPDRVPRRRPMSRAPNRRARDLISRVPLQDTLPSFILIQILGASDRYTTNRLEDRGVGHFTIDDGPRNIRGVWCARRTDYSSIFIDTRGLIVILSPNMSLTEVSRRFP